MSCFICIYQGVVVDTDLAVQIYNILAEKHGKEKICKPSEETSDEDYDSFTDTLVDNFNQWSPDLKMCENVDDNIKGWVVGFQIMGEEYDKYGVGVKPLDLNMIRSQEDFLNAAHAIGWLSPNSTPKLFIKYCN